MKVKELIELLKKCDPEKEVYFSSYSEGIHFGVEGVESIDKHYVTGKEIVSITEYDPNDI